MACGLSRSALCPCASDDCGATLAASLPPKPLTLVPAGPQDKLVAALTDPPLPCFARPAASCVAVLLGNLVSEGGEEHACACFSDMV